MFSYKAEKLLVGGSLLISSNSRKTKEWYPITYKANFMQSYSMRYPRGYETGRFKDQIMILESYIVC